MVMKSTSFNVINGWREVLARVLDGFETEYGLTPEWLVNPETRRRLKLDYFYPEISVAVRSLVWRPPDAQRKSDEEVDAEAAVKKAFSICREHVILVSIELKVSRRIRGLEAGLAKASSQQRAAKYPRPQAARCRKSSAAGPAIQHTAYGSRKAQRLRQM
jgi:hypothetical protein